MTKFKEYPIYKKRDGQDWNKINTIYANGFIEAKKKFAKMMTDDNHSKSNNIVWLVGIDSEGKQQAETGFYDMDSSYLVLNEDETINYQESKLELFCSEKSINRGFAYWNEDVYSWELRKK